MIQRAALIIVGILAGVIILSSAPHLHEQVPTLTIADIFGLQQALEIRPTVGTGFSANGVAVVNSAGSIDTAVGNATDCVYVNGTAGQCTGSTQVSSTTFVDGEIPTGIMNGTNATLTLANVPTPATSLHLLRNGSRLTSGIDYTLSGNAITFIGTQIPIAGDHILADYRQ
jgi:hypothetical protein